MAMHPTELSPRHTPREEAAEPSRSTGVNVAPDSAADCRR